MNEQDERFQDIDTRYLDELLEGAFYDYDKTLELFLDRGYAVPDHWSEGEELSDSELTVLFDARWNARLIEQESWGETTGDRLLTVFNELKKDNIQAEMNFSCCNNCGTTELYEIAREKDLQGYVFFHEQSTERMLWDGTLTMYYGSTSDNTDDDLHVGELLANKLKSQGFEVTWNHTSNEAIKISIAWKKKLQVNK